MGRRGHCKRCVYPRVRLCVILTGEVEKALAEVDQVGQAGLDVLLEVLHGHGREIEEFVRHFVRPPQHLCRSHVVQHVQDLVQDAAGKEAAVLALNVLAKGHL